MSGPVKKSGHPKQVCPGVSQNLNRSNMVRVCTKAAYQLGLLRVRGRMAEPVSETEVAVGAHWGDRGYRPTVEPYFSNNQTSPTQSAAGSIFTVLPQ